MFQKYLKVILQNQLFNTILYGNDEKNEYKSSS